MRLLFLLSYSLLLSCVPSTRGWVVEISGVVASSSGEVLGGSSVEMLDDNGDIISRATTDAAGVRSQSRGSFIFKRAWRGTTMEICSGTCLG
jgi:uncharacterized protein YfaS (alpha-2-macroglobulin family)